MVSEKNAGFEWTQEWPHLVISPQAAAEQVRVMRETVEFSRERAGVLDGEGLSEVRSWLRTTLPGVEAE